MPKALHAADYLASPSRHAPSAVNVVFGDEPFLKRQVLRVLRAEALEGSDAEFSLSVFEGGKADLGDVLDELSTRAMFGGGIRLVLIDEADEFVSRFRSELEAYVAAPRPTGRLVLEVKSWPANTRLYKAVAEKGLPIDCSSPKAAQLPKWLIGWAERAHGVRLESAAAGTLVELVGTELGLLDQEVARLALSVPAGGKITAKLVAERVGSWRARTAWDMLDAALSGNLREALIQLDRLLLAGEHPVAILGQISATLRRYAAATRLVLSAESQRQRISIGSALEQAGVRSFVLRKSETQLRHLGRERGRQLYRWMFEADLALKGNSALPPRLVMETLLIRLSESPSNRSNN